MKTRLTESGQKMRITLFLGCLLLSGCAHRAISENLRDQAVPLSLQEVSQNPEAYKGQIVIWGGEIIDTVRRNEGTTLMQVLQNPLDPKGEPESGEGRSEGRFWVLTDKYLDSYIYRPGRKVTVAGEIVEAKAESTAEGIHGYPVLWAKEINLWNIFGPYSYYGERPPWYDPNYYSPWGIEGRPYRY